MTDALEYARSLVAVPSVSAISNAAVSDVVESHLRSLGFQIERQEFLDPFGVAKVNVIGRKGPGQGGVAYFSHTDVVPADTWSVAGHGPFEPTLRDNRLYGRGSCDMKGSIAAMLAAVSRIKDNELRAPIYVVCTADEEVGFHGAKRVAETSVFYREMVASQSRTIIGEPTELEVVYAHKGIYGFRAVAHGRAAHSSTRDGVNANLAMIPFLAEMKAIHDETLADPAWLNDEFDPPWISWNIGVNDHNRAVNITAPQSVCSVYFRPMPGQDADALVKRAEAAAQRCGLDFTCECRGLPLYGDPTSDFAHETLRIAGRDKARTVAYGTDGVCFTELKQIIVLGPGSIQQAHTDDEWISLDQLAMGTDVYERMLRRWCVESV
ncbi:MAG: M20 family metallopeptidase [Planctomycetota bacterium]